MSLILYKEIGIAINDHPGIKVIKQNDPAPGNPWEPIAHQTLSEAIKAILDIDRYCFKLADYDYKTIRDCIKYIVQLHDLHNVDESTLPINEQADCLFAKEIAAKHNIGTGAQLLAAVPDDEQRDKYSLDYLVNMRGGLLKDGVRSFRVNEVEALFWSRCKHIMIIHPITQAQFTMPALVFDMLNIKTAQPGEISGNLLNHYKLFGLQGVAEDGLVGIYDAFNETPGTRFAPWDAAINPYGGGLRTYFLLQGVQPSGFQDLNSFMDYVFDVLHFGLNPIV